MGEVSIIQQHTDSAITELKLASNIQPEHADTWFWLADAYEQTGDSINAYNSYNMARDFDMNPFRALSSFNDTIRSLAKRHNVPLLDAEIVFKKYSKNGIPGFDMIIDYVHPTKNGNLILCLNAAELINNFSQFNTKNKMATIQSEIVKLSQDGYSDAYDINLQFTRFSLFCTTHQDYSVVSLGNWFLKILLLIL